MEYRNTGPHLHPYSVLARNWGQRGIFQTRATRRNTTAKLGRKTSPPRVRKDNKQMTNAPERNVYVEEGKQICSVTATTRLHFVGENHQADSCSKENKQNNAPGERRRDNEREEVMSAYLD